MIERGIVRSRYISNGHRRCRCAPHQRKTQSGGTQCPRAGGFGCALLLRSLLHSWHGRISIPARKCLHTSATKFYAGRMHGARYTPVLIASNRLTRSGMNASILSRVALSIHSIWSTEAICSCSSRCSPPSCSRHRAERCSLWLDALHGRQPNFSRDRSGKSALNVSYSRSSGRKAEFKEGQSRAHFQTFALQMLLLTLASLIRPFAKDRQAVLTH